MSAANYAQCLRDVLKHEGGYVNHPLDPGGATMRGVTQAVYDGYRTRHGQPAQSVRKISNDELQAIYRLQYWDPIRGDALPLGLDYAVFDFAVNSGVGRAAKYLQMIVGAEADGHIGEITLAKIRAGDPRKLAARLCDKRLAFCKSLKTWRTFGKGWAYRIAAVKKKSTA